MGRHYLKATEVLPPDLLEVLSKALNGQPALISLPSRSSLRRIKRDAYILRLHQAGNTAYEIADQLFLNIRTVFRALERMRVKAGRRPSRPTEAKTQEEPHD